MLHIENAVCSLNSHHCLFLAVFLVVCTVTVRNIKADSDEHFFRHKETNTFVPLTAQSFRSKDKATLDQHMLHTLKDQLFCSTCMYIYFLHPSKLHLWSKIHCRFSPTTTISNLSHTWSRQSDPHGKLHLCKLFYNSASLYMEVWSEIMWHNSVWGDSMHICCSKRPLCGSPIRQ